MLIVTLEAINFICLASQRQAGARVYVRENLDEEWDLDTSLTGHPIECIE
jgi:hypothetical protein